MKNFRDWLKNKIWFAAAIALIIAVFSIIDFLAGPAKLKPKDDLTPEQIETFKRIERGRRQREKELKELQKKEERNKMTPRERQQAIEDLLKKYKEENK
jgi:hypothetical protein